MISFVASPWVVTYGSANDNIITDKSFIHSRKGNA